MLSEMQEVMATILEETYKEQGISIEEVCVALDEVKIIVDRDEDQENVLMFAFHLASNTRCFVEVSTGREWDENEEDEEVIIILNERWRARESIRVIIC